MTGQQPLFGGAPPGEYVTVPELPERALTLHQPWAWLVAHGLKPLENRPPGFSHQSFRGWFWIHASKVQSLDEWNAAAELARQNGITDVPKLYDSALRFGAILGRARIVGVLPVPTLRELPSGWRMTGQFGFVVLDATPLAVPVPCRGYQGFWKVPADVLAELKKVNR